MTYAVAVSQPPPDDARRRSRLYRRLWVIAILVAGHTIIGLLVWDVQRGLDRVQRRLRAGNDLGSGQIGISFAGFAARPAIVYAFRVTCDGERRADAYYNPYSTRVEVVGLTPPPPAPAASPAE